MDRDYQYEYDEGRDWYGYDRDRRDWERNRARDRGRDRDTAMMEPYGRDRYGERDERLSERPYMRREMARDDDYGYRYGEPSRQRGGIDWERERDYERRGMYGREREFAREPERRFGGYGYGREDYERGWRQGRDYTEPGRVSARDWRGDYSRSDYGWRGQAGVYSMPVTYTEYWFFTGPYSGRGPRNYQRSDERIREDVCECLTQLGQVDASDIDVRVQNGEVTLTGNVERREAKRMAEDAVETIPGVKDVHNQLRTSDGQRNQEMQSTQTQNRQLQATTSQGQQGQTQPKQQGQDQQQRRETSRTTPS